MASYMSSWVLGFVSGVGWSGGRTLKETDSAGMKAFVDQYCDAHRLDNINDAAKELVLALVEVKKP